MFRPAHQDHHGANEVCNDCSCLPTIQHEETCHLYEHALNHADMNTENCSQSCTCSRQESCKHEATKEKCMPNGICRIACLDCDATVTPPTGEKHECIGAFCGMTPTCPQFVPVAQEKQDWEDTFIDILVKHGIGIGNARRDLSQFIRKEKELSKEEGRREGYEDGKALRGKEWKQDIEEVRLEVIGAVEDYVRRYYVLHKNDGKPLIEKADILALLDSLKNNSKL